MLLGLVERLMVARTCCMYVGWFACSYGSGTRVINYPTVGYPGSKNQYKSMPQIKNTPLWNYVLDLIRRLYMKVELISDLIMRP